MKIIIAHRELAFVIIAGLAMAGCNKPGGPSAEQTAVCDGPPLRTLERRNKAMEDGHDIDRRFDCITKESVRQFAEQKARSDAANTPEAIAAREVERDRQAEEGKARMAADSKAYAEAQAERERKRIAAEQVPIVPVEINTGSESQLASVPGISADVVQQIMAERRKGRFKGWEDVVQRIDGLHAAETAVRASAFGLTVNGASLEGAEPNSDIGLWARDKYRRRSY